MPGRAEASQSAAMTAAGERRVHREPYRQDVVEERQELRVAGDADRLVAERRRQRHDPVPVDRQLRPQREVDGESRARRAESGRGPSARQLRA